MTDKLYFKPKHNVRRLVYPGNFLPAFTSLVRLSRHFPEPFTHCRTGFITLLTFDEWIGN